MTRTTPRRAAATLAIACAIAACGGGIASLGDTPGAQASLGPLEPEVAEAQALTRELIALLVHPPADRPLAPLQAFIEANATTMDDLANEVSRALARTPDPERYALEAAIGARMSAVVFEWRDAIAAFRQSNPELAEELDALLGRLGPQYP